MSTSSCTTRDRKKKDGKFLADKCRKAANDRKRLKTSFSVHTSQESMGVYKKELNIER